MPQWAIAAIILAAVAGMGGMAVHTYNGALEREAKAQADLKTSRDNESTLKLALTDQLVANAVMTARQELMDEIDVKRGKANVTAAQIEGMINAKLKQLAASSPEVRAWATTPVPSAYLAVVRDELGATDRPGGAGTGAGTAAGQVDRPNGGAGVAAGDDKRRAYGLRPPEPRTPASVQR